MAGVRRYDVQVNVEAAVRGAQAIQNLTNQINQATQAGQRLSAVLSNVGEVGAAFTASANQVHQATQAMVRDVSGAYRRLGMDMTAALTVPLVALGALAAKNAADFDSLKRGLIAVSGSSREAANQLAILKETAKIPGLGFREAVQGAINLQAAGIKFELAEKTLRGFGNALATVGKGKAELDGVITALSQIQSKGKVMAQEINQLAERVPQIRVVLKNAFGTADTEQLQKLGISTEQFLEKVTASLLKLPQATGGAKNTLENFGDTVYQSLVPLGDVLLSVLIPAAERLGRYIETTGQAFQRASEPMRFAIVSIGGIAAATGPAILGLGALAGSVNSMATVYASISSTVLPALAAGFARAAQTVALVGQVMIGQASLIQGYAATLTVATGGWLALAAGIGAGIYFLTKEAEVVRKSAQEHEDAINSILGEVEARKTVLKATTELSQADTRDGDGKRRLTEIYQALSAESRARVDAATAEKGAVQALATEQERLLKTSRLQLELKTLDLVRDAAAAYDKQAEAAKRAAEAEAAYTKAKREGLQDITFQSERGPAQTVTATQQFESLSRQAQQAGEEARKAKEEYDRLAGTLRTVEKATGTTTGEFIQQREATRELAPVSNAARTALSNLKGETNAAGNSAANAANQTNTLTDAIKRLKDEASRRDSRLDDAITQIAETAKTRAEAVQRARALAGGELKGDVEAARRAARNREAMRGILDAGRTGGGGGGKKTGDPLADGIRARIAEIEDFNKTEDALSESANAKFRDRLARELDAVRDAYEQKKISLADYYAFVRANRQADADAEIRDIQRRIEQGERTKKGLVEAQANAKGIADPKEREAEQKRIQGQIADLVRTRIGLEGQLEIAIKRRGDIATTTGRDERNDLERLNEDIRRIFEAEQTAIGNTFGVQANQVEARYQAAIKNVKAELERLQKLGDNLTPEQFQRKQELQAAMDASARTRDAELANVDLAKARADLQYLLNEMKREEAEITAILNGKGANQRDIEAEILKIRQKYNAALTETQARIDNAASRNPTTENVTAARDARTSIDELGRTGVSVVGQIRQNLTGAFTNLFQSITSGSQSAGQAFMAFAQQVIGGIQQMIAQMLAMWVVQKLIGLVGSLGGAFAGGLGAAAPVTGAAQGAGSSIGSIASGVIGGGRAKGGYVDPSKLYWVGENGPELVGFGRHASVLNSLNSQNLAAMMDDGWAERRNGKILRSLQSQMPRSGPAPQAVPGVGPGGTSGFGGEVTILNLTDRKQYFDMLRSREGRAVIGNIISTMPNMMRKFTGNG